jgi:hypothetical protein
MLSTDHKNSTSSFQFACVRLQRWVPLKVLKILKTIMLIIPSHAEVDDHAVSQKLLPQLN